MDANQSQRKLLKTLFDEAVAAGRAGGRLARFLPSPPAGRTVVVGAGKAAGAMARDLDAAWSAELSGVVVTRYGYAVPGYRGRIAVLEAAHPVPDANSAAAARAMLDAVSGLSADDLVIALISGGASALLTAPAEGITLPEKQALTQALLRSGAGIGEINTVRKHISAIKGGRLAAAAFPARVLTLAVSDIPGDAVCDIGSGPAVADPSTRADALAILERRGVPAPAALTAPPRAGRGESPKPGDPRLARAENHIVARPADALTAAAARVRRAGREPIVLGDAIEGEARVVGAEHAALALAAKARGRRICLLSGGETTVTVRGAGRGGRNTEYLLGLLIGLNGAKGIGALAADTDGIDGSESNAGAFVFPDSLARARALGLDPRVSLGANDAYGFFETLGDLLITGPTYTNVNDFRAILID